MDIKEAIDIATGMAYYYEKAANEWEGLSTYAHHDFAKKAEVLRMLIKVAEAFGQEGRE